MTLSSSIEEFTSGLSPDKKKAALRAVSSFVLLGDYRTYREQIKVLPKQHYTVFYKEVLSLLKTSFECRNIWRTVYYSLKHPERKPSFVAKKFKVSKDSVRLVWGSLSPSDREEVATLAKEDMDFGLLTDEEMATLVKSLDRYCGRVSYLKLRFLATNDCAYTLEDLRSELLTKGIQTARFYEHTRDLKMIENYSKAAIQNHALNLVQYYTSESRACVKNVTEGCGTCVHCLLGNPQKCAEAVAAYSLSAVSLDLPGIIKSGNDAERKVRDQLLVSHLKKGANPTVQHIIDVVFGATVDEDFESWMLSQRGVTVDYILDNPRRFVKMLCSYHKIPGRVVNDHLRARYKSYLEAS